MQDAFGGDNLGLDGMVLLFAAIRLFALELVLGLGNRLLGGIEQDFFDLRIGRKEFLESIDTLARLSLSACRGSTLLPCCGWRVLARCRRGASRKGTGSTSSKIGSKRSWSSRLTLLWSKSKR